MLTEQGVSRLILLAPTLLLIQIDQRYIKELIIFSWKKILAELAFSYKIAPLVIHCQAEIQICS